MDRGFKIEVGRVWRELVAELAMKHRPLIRALLLPAVVMTIAEWQADGVTGLAWLPFTAIYWLFAAMFAVSIHRLVLLSSESLSNSWGVYVDRFVLRYIGYTLLIGFGLIFLTAGASLVIVPLGVVLPAGVVVFLMSALWLALLYLMVRLGMVLPAQAVGDGIDLVEMFRKTAGNGWRLVFATMLPLLGATLVLYPLIWMSKSMPVWFGVLAMVLNVLLAGIVGVAALSCAYRELMRLPARLTTVT